MNQSTLVNDDIKAIIFDLGNVLIKVNFDRMLINRVKEQMGSTAHEVMEAAYNDDLFQEFCTGKMNGESFHNALNARFNLNYSYDQFKEKWCDIFEPIKGMPELLSALRKNYKIGLLSDTDPIHWQYVLNAYPFLHTIQNPTLSFEAGYMKPNPQIYRIAAENIGHRPGDCLFIDDRQINVDGAQAAGMKAVQFTNINKLKNFLFNSKWL
ncbi:MAG: HAD family phosphatase [Calditrichaceae bacterium]|nr:HAD family phosphatase [Calditrichaceae bacterium]